MSCVADVRDLNPRLNPDQSSYSHRSSPLMIAPSAIPTGLDLLVGATPLWMNTTGDSRPLVVIAPVLITVNGLPSHCVGTTMIGMATVVALLPALGLKTILLLVVPMTILMMCDRRRLPAMRIHTFRPGLMDVLGVLHGVNTFRMTVVATGN